MEYILELYSYKLKYEDINIIAGMLKAVLQAGEKITVLKNRFFKTDFLFDHPECKIDPGIHSFFGLR